MPRSYPEFHVYAPAPGGGQGALHVHGETNLGDPGLFPGTAELEHRLIQLFGTLFSCPDACGYATSGGTESNIQALRIAKSRSTSARPNVVLPESAHFSLKRHAIFSALR